MAVVSTVGREQMRMSLKNHATSSMGFWKSLDVLNLIISFWGMFSNVTNQASTPSANYLYTAWIANPEYEHSTSVVVALMTNTVVY